MVLYTILAYLCVHFFGGRSNVVEVEEFRKQRRFKLLGIDAPAEERWKRVKKRRRQGDPKTLEGFQLQNATDKGPEGTPHSQQLEQLLEKADKIIINDGTIEQFLGKVDRFVDSLLHPVNEFGE